MRIGLWGGDVSGVKTLERLIDDAVEAEAAGFSSYWLPVISGHDPLIVFTLAASRTSTIEFGTAVVPTYSRHPHALAQTAMSVQIASGGRFVLGIGPSHQRVVEGRLGLTFDKPVANTRDALAIITGLAAGGPVEYSGEEWSVAGALLHPEHNDVPGGDRRPRPADAAPGRTARGRDVHLDDRTGHARWAHGTDDERRRRGPRT